MTDEEKKEEEKTETPAEESAAENESKTVADSSFTPSPGVYVFFAVLAVLLISLFIAVASVKPETPNAKAESAAERQEKPDSTEKE